MDGQTSADLKVTLVDAVDVSASLFDQVEQLRREVREQGGNTHRWMVVEDEEGNTPAPNSHRMLKMWLSCEKGLLTAIEYEPLVQIGRYPSIGTKLIIKAGTAVCEDMLLLTKDKVIAVKDKEHRAPQSPLVCYLTRLEARLQPPATRGEEAPAPICLSD